MDDEFDLEIDKEESFFRRLLGYVGDWGIALLLTGLGFWMLSQWRAPDLPEFAPDWTLKNLESQEVSMKDFRGQTVVLNFWATWCGPCRMEIPTFSKFATDNAHVPVLGIAVDGNKSQLRRAKKEFGIEYPVLMANSSVKRLYKVDTLPTTVVVDPDGRIKDVHVGIMLGPQLRWATRNAPK